MCKAPTAACTLRTTTERSGASLQTNTASVTFVLQPAGDNRGMCGRYALYGPRKRSRAEAEYFSTLDQFPSKWNVAPTDTMPIARMRDGALELVPARWGLIPYFSKDAKGAFRCINARAETVATTASFRQPWKTGRRCLVPANGFFEWETRPDGKQPFYFTSAEGSLLAFAGLWDTWRQPDGSSLLSYTIITTAPNDFVKRFHDRMPVILDEADYESLADRWRCQRSAQGAPQRGAAQLSREPAGEQRQEQRCVPDRAGRGGASGTGSDSIVLKSARAEVHVETGATRCGLVVSPFTSSPDGERGDYRSSACISFLS